MAAEAKVGRSREELLAAAAALTAAAEDLPDEDEATAVVLLERVRILEQDAMDAPPSLAVQEQDLVSVISVVGALGARTVLGSVGLPVAVAKGVAYQEWGRVLGDPIVREEMLASVRHLLAGRCLCGEPVGHDGGHEDGERP